MTDRARELLERVLEVWDEGNSHSEISGAFEVIREFLSTPEPTQDDEPIGYAVKMFPRGLHFIGFTVDDEIQEEIEEYGKESIVPLYLHPAPRTKFVRLSEEEITRIGNKTGINWNLPRAIEDALEEKNK